jgi:hypothetical protein
MAPHGKQMTPEEKQIIVALSQQGYDCTLVPNSKFLKKTADLIYDWFCIEYEYHGCGGICIGLEGELKHDFLERYRVVSPRILFAP